MTPTRRRPLTLVMLATALPAFMATLDNLVMTTALPVLHTSLGAGLDELAWMVNAFTLAFATLMLPAATLGDRWGRRRVFAVGISVFMLASVASALSTTAGELIAARAVQGAGAAAIMPLSLTLLAGTVPPARRAMAIGLWGAVSGTGVALGPVLGGAVIEGMSWQAMFWLNVPVAIASLALVGRYLPESFGRDGRLDLLGLALASTGVFALVWGTVRGNDDGWGSGPVLTSLVGGTLALAAFTAHQARTGHPLVPLRLFRHRSFTVATVAGLLFSAGAFGAVFLLSQFLQIAGGYSPLAAGVRTLPWTAAPMLVAPFAGLATARIGARPLLVSGLASLAAGIAWMAPLVTRTPMDYAQFVPGLLLAGLGMGLVFAPSSTAVLADLPDADHGTASSVNATARELGTALGVAVLVAVFEAADGSLTPTGFGQGLQVALVVAAAVVAVAAVAALLMPARTGRRDGAPVTDRAVEPALV